jgi:hypothetical protein
VGERYNRYGKRLLLRVDEKTICSVPPQWIDLVAVDPAVTLSQSRALFLLTDLMELDRLIGRFRERKIGDDDRSSM